MPYFEYTKEDYQKLLQAFKNPLDDESVALIDFFISRGILKSIEDLQKQDWSDIVKNPGACILEEKPHRFILAFLRVFTEKFKRRAENSKNELMSHIYASYVDRLTIAEKSLLNKKHVKDKLIFGGQK